MAIGTLLGGAAGAALGGPVGAQVGAGLGSTVEGMFRGKRAKQMLPPYEDPMMRGYLNELDQKRKSFATGSAYAQQMRELKNIQAGQNAGMITAAGGNTGALISGLARTGQSIGDAYGKIAAEGEARMDEYGRMYGDLLNTMAQRKAELQMLRYGQEAQTSAEMRKQGMQTLLNLAPMVGGNGMPQTEEYR